MDVITDSMTPNLPGLATHLTKTPRVSACGIVGSERMTTNEEHVDCMRCRRTIRAQKKKR